MVQGLKARSALLRISNVQSYAAYSIKSTAAKLGKNNLTKKGQFSQSSAVAKPKIGARAAFYG
jgi:hypothetical protein